MHNWSALSKSYGGKKRGCQKKSDEILGFHIIGARAADLIIEGVTAMEFRASCEDISMMSHPHPTYSEAIKEAALSALENRPLHI